MSQIPKSAARRTPLSLSGSAGGGGGGGGGSTSSAKHRKTSTESVDKASSNDSRSSTPVTVSLEKINVDASVEKMKAKYTMQQQQPSTDAAGSNEKQQKSIPQKTTSKQGENSDKVSNKNGNEKTAKDDKSIKNGNSSTDKSANQNGNSHNNTNNKTAKDQSMSAPAKNDSSNKKTASEKVTEPSLKQSSSSSQQQQQQSQTQKDATVRESPRQKDLRETKEKEDAEKQKLLEKKEIEEAIAAVKAEELKAVKPAQITSPPASTPTAGTPTTAAAPPAAASPPKQQPPTIAVIPPTPDPKSPEKKRTTATPKLPSTITANATTNSLALEQDMKGFTSDGDEMESIILDNEFSDSPMPKSTTKNNSKILKLTQGPPSSASRSRISPYRTAALNKATAIAMASGNASIQINLSTVSELSTESHGHVGVSPPLPTSDDQTLGSSLRRISGRKSLRPLREISIQNSYRETYRRLPTDLNDSFSSLNATVGSEIPNESFRTPYRKRTAAVEDLDADFGEEGQKASPKRARLDLSAFLSLVASPVTMLRNKFARSKLTCSTPNAKKDSTGVAASTDTVDNDDAEEIDEVKQSGNLNVSGIEETNDFVMLNSDERTCGDGEVQAVDNIIGEENDLNNGDDDAAADAEVEKTVSGLKEKIEEGDDVAAGLSDIDGNEQPPRPRSRCRLM